MVQIDIKLTSMTTNLYQSNQSLNENHSAKVDYPDLVVTLALEKCKV